MVPSPLTVLAKHLRYAWYLLWDLYPETLLQVVFFCQLLPIWREVKQDWCGDYQRSRSRPTALCLIPLLFLPVPYDTAVHQTQFGYSYVGINFFSPPATHVQ